MSGRSSFVMTTSPSGFCMSEPTLPRNTLGAMPIEQVRHSPTCSRNARLTLSASCARDRDLPFSAHQLAGHFVDRADLLDRQAGVDGLQDALVIVAVEPVIGLHRDDGGTQPPRLAHEGAGLDAECLGRVAGGDRDGGIRERLHDDDGLAAQGRGSCCSHDAKKALRSRNSHWTALSAVDLFIFCSIA